MFYGGCFRNGGTAIVNSGTVMRDNTAIHGGCIYAHDGSTLNIVGGNFMCRSTRTGGFLHAGDAVNVTIAGGVIANNVAETRGGAIHCVHADGKSTISIEGGTFENNSALELGGVISASGESKLVNITGGVFSNNTAKFFGGFLHLNAGASFTCERATIQNNYAGGEGGAIYARGSTWLNSTCDLIANESPQGAALFLTGAESVTLKHLTVADNLGFSGSVLYMTTSSVVVDRVTFISGINLQEDSPYPAVQSNGNSELTLKACVFDGWLVDTVIYHNNPKADSLVLDRCDFSRSSAAMAVFSLNADAKIRNAVVGDFTFTNPSRLNNSLALVNRALDCSDPTVCGPGECMDSALGVLCECLEGGTCLDGGGVLSLNVKTPPPVVTYVPDRVSFELVVSSVGGGDTYTIWRLEFEAKDLNLDVAPSRGLLPPGGNITVAVTGTPTRQDVNGNMTSSFNLTSVGTDSSNFTAERTLEVESTVFLCSAYKYAEPLTAEDGAGLCKPCMSIRGGEGVDCESPGSTLASLTIKQGYWRSSSDSRVVHKCGLSEACVGSTEVLSADNYCENGYQGPYCAVCSEGYGRGVSNTCNSCDNSKAQLIISVGIITSVVMLLLMVILAVVFLVGGLDAIDNVRKSVSRNVSVASKASKVWYTSRTGPQERHYPERRTRKDYSNDIIDRAFDVHSENKHCSGECYTGDRRRESPRTSPAPDESGRTYFRPSSAVFRPGDSVGLSDAPARQATQLGTAASHHARLRTNDGGKSKRCGLGVNIKAWASRLPLDKLKILLVVWQIQSVFVSITSVEFPASYSMFLSWINIVSFDIGHVVSASCILPSADFYASLLVATLTPLALAAGMVLTYQMAKRREGLGSDGVIARREAWSRHVAAGLLLAFLVFTSSSTLVFETFACDDVDGDGKSYLRADYSILCESSVHTIYKGYAMLMILVYPIGIPALYAVILWRNRELLNPRTHTVTMSEPDENDEGTTRADSTGGAGILSSYFSRIPSTSHITNELSRQEVQEVNQRERARREHPELTASMFLWKDFGPGLFYYEVIECGRRMLLTGVLVFIAPNSSTQVAVACVFAFGSLLGFELMRPHLDANNAWLYRLGCVVIFLSYFLALLIKVDVGGEVRRSTFACVLVAINVLLVITVFTTSWFTVQQSVDDVRDRGATLTGATTVRTTEQDATTSAIISAANLARHGLTTTDPAEIL